MATCATGEKLLQETTWAGMPGCWKILKRILQTKARLLDALNYNHNGF